MFRYAKPLFLCCCVVVTCLYSGVWAAYEIAKVMPPRHISVTQSNYIFEYWWNGKFFTTTTL